MRVAPGGATLWSWAIVSVFVWSLIWRRAAIRCVAGCRARTVGASASRVCSGCWRCWTLRERVIAQAQPRQGRMLATGDVGDG